MLNQFRHAFCRIRLILLSFLLLQALPTFAQPAFESGLSSRDSSLLSGLSSGNTDFLKVHEAYVLSVSVEADELRLQWDIAPGYYLYKDNFRVKAYSDGQPVPLELRYEEGVVKYDEYFEQDMEVFYDETILRATLPPNLNSIELAVTSQGCADAGLCYPPYTENYRLDLMTGIASPIATLSTSQTQNGASGAGSSSINPSVFAYTLLLALMGGVILNLMPCVFPVLSIKAMSLMSAGSDGNQRAHGWAYTLGAVLSFLVIGGIILSIRAAGGSADWGRQLQSPAFVALMTYLFLVMGLSLSGFVQFGTRLMGAGQSLTTRGGLQGSFFTGALAVVVASPCTAPFMAPALGVALTQPATIALAVFAALGLGMALPFLLLSYSPRLAQLMPRPGPWMETFKQFLAFPLYLTAVWLLWVLGRQSGVDAAAAVVAGGVALSFGLWLTGKKPASPVARAALYGTAGVSALLALSVALQPQQFGKNELWQPYSAELVTELRQQGRPVFVNLTAAWCITCHANERVALNREAVIERARELNVALVKGDWTNEDPRITALLHQYQRAGVPTYLMYPADPTARAEILPQILTPDIVIRAMERAAGSKVAAAGG